MTARSGVACWFEASPFSSSGRILTRVLIFSAEHPPAPGSLEQVQLSGALLGAGGAAGVPDPDRPVLPRDRIGSFRDDFRRLPDPPRVGDWPESGR